MLNKKSRRNDFLQWYYSHSLLVKTLLFLVLYVVLIPMWTWPYLKTTRAKQIFLGSWIFGLLLVNGVFLASSSVDNNEAAVAGVQDVQLAAEPEYTAEEQERRREVQRVAEEEKSPEEIAAEEAAKLEAEKQAKEAAAREEEERIAREQAEQKRAEEEAARQAQEEAQRREQEQATQAAAQAQQTQQNQARTVAPTPQPTPGLYFKDCTDARNQGYSNILRGEPGYASKLDRNNDGVACES